MSAMEGALRRKEEVRRYYEITAAAGPRATSGLFALLARDEERHHEAMRALERGAQARLDPSETLEQARFMLRRLAVTDTSCGAPEELEVFYRAMDLEAASADAYGRLASASSGLERELFSGIAAEEEMHFTLLEHLRELLDPALTGGRACKGVEE